MYSSHGSLMDPFPIWGGFEFRVFCLLGWLKPQRKRGQSILLFNTWPVGGGEEIGLYISKCYFCEGERNVRISTRTQISFSNSITITPFLPPNDYDNDNLINYLSCYLHVILKILRILQ